MLQRHSQQYTFINKQYTMEHTKYKRHICPQGSFLLVTSLLAFGLVDFKTATKWTLQRRKNIPHIMTEQLKYH